MQKKYTRNIQQHYIDYFKGKTYSCGQCEKVYNFKSDLIAYTLIDRIVLALE